MHSKVTKATSYKAMGDVLLNLCAATPVNTLTNKPKAEVGAKGPAHLHFDLIMAG